MTAPAAFNVTTAVLAAGFAFEAYNEPDEQDARWERGADGCDVAFMSEEFAREVYAGRLEVRLCEAKELSVDQDLAQTLMTGGQRDPYVIFAMNEENEKGPKEGAIGLGRAVDRARSSTVWSKSVADQAKDGLSNLFKGSEGDGSRDGCATWPDDEVISLYVKDPARAQLALTVFDEEIAASDKALGATSVHLADLLKPDGRDEAQRQWSGWVPLTWRPPETEDNVVLGLGAGQIGMVAGAAVAGPLGAAAGAALGSLVTKPVTGQIRLELKYTPLRGPNAQPLPPMGQGPPPAASAPEAGTEVDVATADSAFKATLATRGLAKGGSEGIDWSTLSRRVGELGADENAQFELCCFLTHRGTSSEAAIWRDTKQRLVVIAFRGTSDILDVLTDINLLQTPLEQGYNGQKSDDARQVHQGFFASARAVSRRVKELLVSATAGTPGEWSLLITGHSLGGALAQLMATELIGGVDTSRGFKERDDASLFGMASRLFTQAKESMPQFQLPRWREVALYTYGAPRVGNGEFAAFFEALFAGREAFRIVNDRDIVPRLPRGGGVAGAVLEYEHVGRTVLVAEKASEAAGFDGFWVEGQSDEADCPLRDVSPLSNPFSSGGVLADVGEETKNLASTLGSTLDKIDAAAKVRSRDELKRAVYEGLASFEKAKDSISGRLQGIKAADALAMVGIDSRFVASELQLVESLAQGQAIEHHLEPSYYVAMTKALDADERARAAPPSQGPSSTTYSEYLKQREQTERGE